MKQANPQLIDSHCHLDHSYGHKTAADLVEEAADDGISPLITIGTSPASSQQVRALSESLPGVYHTVGVHPHDAAAMEDHHLAELARAAAHPRCVAIGEIGLDYHYDTSPRDTQRARLADQLELALEVDLPVVIHVREADDDLLAALRPHAARLPADRIPGVLHCFSSGRSLGEACLELGFYISFSGMLTFGWADELRACARDFPLDRLLVETDSPYLAPIPHRGKRCEPRLVRHTAEKLAEVRGAPIEEIARATVQNTRRLFNLPEE